MGEPGGRILLVDDDEDLLKLLAAQLAGAGFTAVAATSAEAALAILDEGNVSVLLTDVQMPGTSGTELCARSVAGWPDVPVIVMTVQATLETAVQAIRAGAHDFITKPIRPETLQLRIQHAVQLRSLRTEVRRLRRSMAGAGRLGVLVGASEAMQKVYRLIEKVAGADASVLIVGESGTGKELVARVLHQRSARAGGPFVAINCAAVPEALLESELFGHARGAFTDAHAAREGLLVRASKGTLFLDEVGEMPPPMQAKLLRALQERKVRPVGGSEEVSFDARIVAATNRDLEASIEEGKFREDLLFRLDVVRIELPPLRARAGDVLVLAQHFLEQFAARANRKVLGISPEVAQKLLAYSWPGNARELQNCMERAVAVARYDQIVVEDLPERVAQHQPTTVMIAAQDPSEIVPLSEIEKRYILQVIEAFAGNKTLAARALGIGRKTLYRKLEEFGVK